MAELATVARPYAEAAFKLARETQQLQHRSEMFALIAALARDEQIASRIGDLNVDDHALESFNVGSLRDRLDGTGGNLWQGLVQNGRLELVPHIREMFDELKREHEGVLEAKIISAQPVGDEQIKPLLSALERKYGRKVSAQVEVDPELIGGARILVGDKVIDATVRGRLDAMAAALTH